MIDSYIEKSNTKPDIQSNQGSSQNIRSKSFFTEVINNQNTPDRSSIGGGPNDSN